MKLAHALKDFGQRVQYSVFECHLDTEQLGRLRSRLTPLLEPKEDQVRLYILCGECTPRMEIHGAGGRTEDPDVYVL